MINKGTRETFTSTDREMELMSSRTKRLMGVYLLG